MIDFFKVDEKVADDSILVLIIYDIENNKKRTKLAKHLQRYGFRVQKSAFEGIIKENKYDKLVKELAVYGSDKDSVRIYKSGEAVKLLYTVMIKWKDCQKQLLCKL